jgi:pimeloyl-ACP methyl ester carboxylesterase
MESRARKSMFTNIDGKEIHYSQWGQKGNPAIICLHGLTRNGRDFDRLAESLSHSYQILCPDMIGRGLSHWSKNPSTEYCFDYYHDLLLGFVDALNLTQIIWIGTSMGGALGIKLAGSSLKKRITHLVLNDIGAGPTVEALKNLQPETANAIKHIISYTGNPPSYPSIKELEAYYKSIYQSFGLTSEEEWQAFTETSARRMDNGLITPDYDPAIVQQFNHENDLLLWDSWDNIQAKVLVLRGETSGVLPLDTLEEMKLRGPEFTFKEFKGLGHAPALNTTEQLDLICSFIRI